MYPVDQIRMHLRESERVDFDLTQRLTVRLSHLSQYSPELRPPLSVGYSLSRGAWTHLLWRDSDGIPWLHIGARSRTRGELLDLLDVALDTATENSGGVLSSAHHIEEMVALGTLKVVTDA